MALGSLPALPIRLLSAPSSLPLVSWAMLLACSSITLIAVWATVTAVSLLPRPTLVSMVRSTEIPISLFTEALYWSELPGPVSVLGSIIVSPQCDILACVMTQDKYSGDPVCGHYVSP